MADGWEDVTDPGEIRKVLGAGALNLGVGSKGMSPAEDKMYQSEIQARGGVPEFVTDLARAEVYNRRVPAGRANALITDTVQNFPDGWKSPHIADAQAFRALSRNIIPGVIMAHSGGVFSGKMMDAAAEQQAQAEAVPSYRNEPAANTAIVNRLSEKALRNYAQARFTSQWRQKYGSIGAPDERGRDALSVFNQQYGAIPSGVGPKKPLSTYVDEAAEDRRTGRSRPAGYGRRLSPDEAAQLPRGTPFIGQDGKRRIRQ